MSGEGARGGHNFLSLFYVSTNFKRIFFEKNRRTLFGSLKCRQTLFNAQILFYKDFYDFFRFTRPSPIVNGFPSFAMDLRVANWRPTYLPRMEKKSKAKNTNKIDCLTILIFHQIADILSK